MDLWEILKVSKGLPPDSLYDMLLAGILAKYATISGYPCILENSAGKPAVDYKIYGNTVQNGTPTPDGSIEAKSVGELVTEGENSGKYAVPIVSSGKNLFDANAKYEAGATTYNFTIKNLDTSKYYTCSTSFEKSVSTASVYFGGGNSTVNGVWKDEPKTFKPDSEGKIIVLIRYKISDGAEAIFNKIKSGEITVMVEEGASSTEYEPYQEPITTLIYLDEPLKIGDILKYTENVIERSDGTKESISLPRIQTLSGTTVITTDTDVQPYNMEITYKAR